MGFIRHAGVFPIIENLAGKFGTLGAGLITFHIDRAIIHRADFKSEVFYVKWSALDGVATATVLIIIAAFTIYAAW